MTIFIVTSGCYSDYQIDGVFSTREQAEAFNARANTETNGTNDGTVEEWELDGRIEDRKHAVYRVYLEEGGDEYQRTQYECMGTPASLQNARPYAYSSGTRFIGSSVKSYDHALKLAAECRQAWLRDRAGEACTD